MSRWAVNPERKAESKGRLHCAPAVLGFGGKERGRQQQQQKKKLIDTKIKKKKTHPTHRRAPSLCVWEEGAGDVARGGVLARVGEEVGDGMPKEDVIWGDGAEAQGGDVEVQGNLRGWGWWVKTRRGEKRGG